MKASPQEVKTSLLEDVAESARAKGTLPSTVDNERYIQGVLDTLDRKETDAKKVVRPTTEKKPGAFEKEVEARCKRHGLLVPDIYEVSRKQAPIALGGEAFVAKAMGTAEKRMRRRLRQLWAKPEWRERFKRINPLVLQGQFGEAKKKEAEALLWKIVAEADAKFGDWWKEGPARPLWFS